MLVVIAGQIPPPIGGQTLYIQRIIGLMREEPSLEVLHWPFHFTPDLSHSRKASLHKVLALFQAWAALIRIRLRGKIDLMIYPAGGPQTVPLIRDLLLLPLCLLFCRTVAIQFHAAGVADRFSDKRGLLFHLIRNLYHRIPHAIVMSEFNRSDPACFEIQNIHIIPHTFEDEAAKYPQVRQAQANARDPSRPGDRIRILSLGHLCPDKGTDFLLSAFAKLSAEDPSVELHLVGEPLPPFDSDSLEKMLKRSPAADRIHFHGLLTGEAKANAFASADIFVFPSVAPYESFGMVIVEAMAWGLPVVISDWRANLEVVGSDFDGIAFDVSAFESRSENLLGALIEAVNRQRTNPVWGQKNRASFETRYSATGLSNPYTKFAMELRPAERVVIAGQIPPPIGGQTLYIQRKIDLMREDPSLEVVHWAFDFTTDLCQSRKASLHKVLALFHAWATLTRIRLKGKIDLMIYPAGGPQTVPLIRDLLLLPLCLLFCRTVAIQFHAAGVADRFSEQRGLLFYLIRNLYHRIPHAIVMSEFNRRDPACFGIQNIHIIPHTFEDDAAKYPQVRPAQANARDPSRPGDCIRILSLGHLCPDKGTDFLLAAFAKLAAKDPSVELHLVGEPLPTFDSKSLKKMLKSSPAADRIHFHGLLTGEAKANAFASTDIFVFPSVAPYESFGQVIVQACMWGLPIVISDWRANLEVAGPDFEGISFDVNIPERRAQNLQLAFQEAIQKKRTNPLWGQKNRASFEARYLSTPENNPYTKFAREVK